MSATLKRFYKDVSLASHDEGGYAVLLDGRTAKTPGRNVLRAEARILAEALAEEWRAQGEEIRLDDLPLTRMQGFALDGAEKGRGEWSETIKSFAGSDLLCYRASDPKLAKRQAEMWQPPLDQIGGRCGLVFQITEGVMAVDQPAELEGAIDDLLNGFSSGAVFATKLLTEAYGSAVLALAVAYEEISAAEAFAASRLDETFQNEVWGVDAEAAARDAAIQREAETIVRFLFLSEGKAYSAAETD